ncbi:MULTISPECIES: hypothetical protein [unclassified Streptococcus]|uniref:hypothetical protein n=1 Tax=unclassified Streptococcus TaxID=2608887 RepID=UPI001071B709|nr:MULTISPECIES: hypothetical protein [unclassified Streptococcus]MBF0787406.1 hypothetical protein [Streptococcus sp. 19428wC2_LYSM12]MCQ9211769.1 hypothetical protein [Streptococcus sp. B01]MCQ9213042.1 hypothetical protein [Streptococcus sp. O1]TFV05627.1 hypothetical protein E4T79_05810 [Streptococcus sp. LYSM12]
MKEKVVEWQAKLMDIIIVSALAVLGLLTIIGGVYGLLLAFVYLAPLSDSKWTVVKDKKVIAVCIGLQFLVYLFLVILLLNLQLLSVLPNVLVIVSSFLLTVLSIVSFSLLTTGIWQLARGCAPSRELLYQGVKGLIVGVPSWIGLFALLCVVGVAVVIYPPCLVVVIGSFLQLLNKTSEQVISGRRER